MSVMVSIFERAGKNFSVEIGSGVVAKIKRLNTNFCRFSVHNESYTLKCQFVDSMLTKGVWEVVPQAPTTVYDDIAKLNRQIKQDEEQIDLHYKDINSLHESLICKEDKVRQLKKNTIFKEEVLK